MDLALHDIERTRQLLRGLDRLGDTHGRKAGGDVRAIGLQDRLALIFMDVHG
jgi:hypothetical protein